MRRTVSIDPGVNEIGIAFWKGTTLFSAELIRSTKGWLDLAYVTVCWSAPWASDNYIDTVVIEKPQVYKQHLLKGDPNDLISLAMVVGAVAVEMTHAWPGIEVETVLPREWKGQTPKSISVERTQRALSGYERDCVQLPKAKSLHHNVWDAVGIGLHRVGRK